MGLSNQAHHELQMNGSEAPPRHRRFVGSDTAVCAGADAASRAHLIPM